jgi:hypothetical protein
MAKSEDLEAYLTRLDRRYQKVDEETYLVGLGAGRPVLAMRVAPPVLVLQVDIGPAPSGVPAVEAPLFRKLLELNGSDLLHSAYAIEGQRIVLTAALEMENLDLNELEAVLANIDMAVALHVPVLRELSQAKAG